MKSGHGSAKVRLAATLALISFFAINAPLYAQPNNEAQPQSTVRGPITLSADDLPGPSANEQTLSAKNTFAQFSTLSQSAVGQANPNQSNLNPPTSAESAANQAATNQATTGQSNQPPASPATPTPSSSPLGKATGASSTSPTNGGSAANAGTNVTTDLTKLDDTHDKNSVLDLGSLRLDSSLKPEQFQPIRLEVSFDQMITLKEALQYALENNLAIKISKDNLNYQRYVLYGQVANMLPNLSMAFNLTHTDIINEKIGSLAKVFLTRVSYPVFQGGSVAYSIIAQYYRERGWHQAFKGSVHDELLDLYQKYNNLLLSRALLQIRGKAVDVSQTQLDVNQNMEKQGTGTRFAVLQADAQLSSDKQALLQQEVAVRQAALALNFSMNSPMAVNLVPAEDTVREQQIFPENVSIDGLLTMALQNRPELREYEDFKVAAGRNIQVAAAPLYPQASFFTQYSFTNTKENTSAPSASNDTSGAGVFGGAFSTYQQGFALVWSLNNFGLTSVANLFAAGSLDRQSRIQANQELETIIQQVRSDYLNWRAAREQIDNAAHSVRASQEELRLAVLRKQAEVTTELEVISSERDYINSLTSQATAIVNSNLAQAQLLHDVGLISQDTLLNGYRGKI
ncbi:MAG TPA: TolC family protein [Planktothrix sp.]|jgi:OMF family outer membrane factor